LEAPRCGFRFILIGGVVVWRLYKAIQDVWAFARHCYKYDSHT
jgi:hypothetical protein